MTHGPVRTRRSWHSGGIIRAGRAAAVVGLVAAVTGTLAAPAAGAGPAAWPPVVQNLARISVQEAPDFPGIPPDLEASQPDTLAEPDVAASPLNPSIAVAASQEGRFAGGGAVSISHAWTRDGGTTWGHAPVTGLTRATGGIWDRVTDPVLAFGPGGDVYLSTIALSSSATRCRSAVLVSRSVDGGATFAAPVVAHATQDCRPADDKSWITVDTGARSPHRGRIYLFWSATAQVVRWSDNHGRTWSPIVQVSSADVGTTNSQPVVQPDGTLVNTYLDFTFILKPAIGLRIVAIRSADGGATWSRPVVVAKRVDIGDGRDVRCCLPSGTADPVTGQLAVAWRSETVSDVLLSRSADGVRWSAPLRVTGPASAGIQRINVDVAAYDGRMTVSYATRDTNLHAGRYWQQQFSTSRDGGLTFAPAQSIGPRYDSRFAALAGDPFPGDYIGSAAVRGRTYLVWPVASRPPDPRATSHQVLYGAALRP